MCLKSQEINEKTLLITFDRERIDLTIGQNVKNLMQEKLAQKYSAYIIDMGHVAFMDSSGLGILIMAWQTVNQNHRSISFINLSSTMKKLFSVAKMDQFLKCADNLQDALNLIDSDKF